MSKKKTSTEEVKDLILQKAKENRVVMTFEGLMSMDLDEIIKQPTEGLLYDLNRDKATVLSWIDDPKWVNDFAVAMVIEKLKEQNEQLQKEIDRLYDEKAGVDL